MITKVNGSDKLFAKIFNKKFKCYFCCGKINKYSKMNILVANNKLERVGGTEIYTLSLIKELKNQGHNVEYFTRRRGEISERIEKELGVCFKSKKQYDLILANHNKIVRQLFFKANGPIIQTIHGITPRVEKPSIFADCYVAISREIKEYLNNKYHLSSEVILNGIDCNKFKPITEINTKLSTVLSLSQSEEANTIIEEACEIVGVDFIKANKQSKTVVKDVLEIINKSDLVVGLGRSAYEAMACARPVIVFDCRKYMGNRGDGYLNEVIDESIIYNCSGRSFNKKFEINDLVCELEKYNKSDGQTLREYILKNLEISKQVAKYLEINTTTRSSLISKIFSKKQLIKLKFIKYNNENYNNKFR